MHSRIHGREWHCGDRVHSDGVPAVGRAADGSHLCDLGSLSHYQGGNLGMMVLCQSDPCLQTPRYFLSHLSFLDICYSYAIVPQWLETLDTDKMVTTFERCMTQCFSFTLWTSTEWFLLAMMDSDHYVAVCNPFLYATSMTPQTCLALVLVHMLVACSIPQLLWGVPSQSPSVSPTR